MSTQHATLARIIGAIGERDFAAVAADAVSGFMEFDLATVVVHRRQAHPTLMFDNFDAAGGRQGVDNYVAFTHRLNPIPPRGGGQGVFRARDFAIRPRRAAELAERYLLPAPEEELGFRTIGWPERLEEIGLYFEAFGGTVELGCYRRRGRAPTERLDELAALCEPIAAAFDRHARLSTPSAAVEALSPREREVADLLLAGCGSEAIALRLRISRHTVKDHRKQIFRKLRIGSLAELFALQRRADALN
jgi:DNA-binding CsgD family transcriptional regulator